MGIRERIKADLPFILENKDVGFAKDCEIKNPAGVTETFQVQSGDIHLLLDTGAGVPVNNRIAHVSINIASLTAKGFDLPAVQPKETKNPWEFRFAGQDGVIRSFTIFDVMPDRTLGIVTVILELLK